LTLEQKLADDPSFFCEVIKTVFRSDNEKENDLEITDERKQLAEHAFRLLDQWKTPPGSIPNNGFDVLKLNNWLTDVKKLCQESGHLNIALDQTGKVLVHSPADKDGLWITKGVAEVVDEKDAEVMRSAFKRELINRRGIYSWSAGKEEHELSLHYRQKADDVENRGYIRFATSLRELANFYDRQSERDATRNPFED